MSDFGIYLHVPYCLKHCSYCDFFTMPLVGDRKDSFQPYLKALVQEIQEVQGDWKNRKVSSIFMGGGTPSLLEPNELELIFSELKRCFSWEEGIEVTMEMNPESITPQKIRDYRSLGLNRVSMGVQSLRAEGLNNLGREHSVSSSWTSYTALREAGFENINLDFIYGRPQHSLEEWREELLEIMSWSSEHLSFYELSLEKGTDMTRKVSNGTLVLPDQDKVLDMYRLTRTIAKEAGYDWYEVSNFCKNGKKAQHNWDIWNNKDYIGLGPGAHSFRSFPGFGERRANPRNLKKYYEAPNGASWEKREQEEALLESFLNSFRLLEGFSWVALLQKYDWTLPASFWKKAKTLQEQGFMEIAEDTLRLEEKGIEVLNSILDYLFLE